MVKIPVNKDPTLTRYNQIIEQSQAPRHRPYLGMSAIGNECSRQLWYSFRWCDKPHFDAATLKRFEDGHRTEDLIVARLAAIPELTVHAVDPNTNYQFGFRDIDGHFRGHMDGVCLGLIQAPKSWHVLEIKCSAKLGDLDKAKAAVGEKNALLKWNETYYAQAVLYMDYAEIDRHYLVCVSPGGREETSVRTNADPDAARALRMKAYNIIYAQYAPPRISESPDFYKCRWCDFADVCHGQKMPEANCRTCLHSTPARDSLWHCARWDRMLSDKEQDGCPAHLFIPSLIHGEQVDAGNDWVSYRMPDGSIFIDGIEANAPTLTPISAKSD
jgi:hypothetical protein